MGGAQFHLDQAHAAPAEDARALPVSGRNSTSGTASNTDEDNTDEIVFDAFKLDESSERVIEALGEDEEVVVLMPAKEFLVACGPKRTVLYWLCRDVAMAENINVFLEGEFQEDFELKGESAPFVFNHLS